MLNYWWVTRPKRRLNSIPETLACCAKVSLDQEWKGQRDVHLMLEKELEDAGIKRKGSRRDRKGSGGRTYLAWILSLGLVFMQEDTEYLKLTLAGEAIMSGDSPVAVLKNQILKYQFPSSFSTSRGVNVSPRFKIRPFRFLLRLLSDADIEYLTEEEIAKIIITETENETEQCCKKVKEKILEFRMKGDLCLDKDFFEKYSSGKGQIKKTFKHLEDIANTIMNWIEYTQLAKRGDDRMLRIIPDKADEVNAILAEKPPFIDRPENHEYFQRKYGVDPKHSKDTRNLTESKTITASLIAEQKIKQAFISESLKAPIGRISAALIDKIAEQTGIIDMKLIEETLLKLYPHGAVGLFMTEYFEMAFKGRDEAVEFEKATAELFKTVMGFETRRIGSLGRTPDVLILSDTSGFCGIIDNKAYSRYTISNDHKNRMIHNYIKGLSNYYEGKLPLAFFSYIAGGFGRNINAQLQEIVSETSVHGSAVSVSNIIAIADMYKGTPVPHTKIKEVFSLDRQVLLSDLNKLM